jgi:hypothetical protein
MEECTVAIEYKGEELKCHLKRYHIGDHQGLVGAYLYVWSPRTGVPIFLRRAVKPNQKRGK